MLRGYVRFSETETSQLFLSFSVVLTRVTVTTKNLLLVLCRPHLRKDLMVGPLHTAYSLFFQCSRHLLLDAALTLASW